uniref:PsbP C-terminal domain-containing protein n=1 Tax=Oryza meridionalis TaxID=40149 RepID=A0A0E0DR64_9ORYZ
MAPAVLLRLAPSPPFPQKPPPRRRSPAPACGASRRDFAIHTAIASAAAAVAVRPATAAVEEAPATAPPGEPSQKKKGFPVLGGIANTKSWSQYYGSGFSIRVPPSFDDILEPEEFNVGMTYYGDKAKPRTYAARFASPDRSELVSVVIKPSNQLKITFLEAKDITDLGTLKEASKIFVPGGAKLYSARTIKVKDEDDIRTYYFYEFGVDKEHVAVMATVNSGKTYIAGATAPETKWDDDGVKLRSAAVSLSVL